MPVKNLFPYQVKIYITYETEEWQKNLQYGTSRAEWKS
jgi:hypothetical protein